MRFRQYILIALFAPMLFAGQAFAASADSISEGPILRQIDKTQAAVLAVIPAPIKDTVASIAASIDAWRAKCAKNFSDARDAAQATIHKKTSTTTTEVKTSVLGTKAVPVTETKTDATWRTYVSLYFFTFLAFIFSTPLVFYIVSIFLAYIVLGFIFRRLGRLRLRRSA